LTLVGEWLLQTPLPPDLKRIPLAPYPQTDRWGIGGHGWFRTQSLYNGMVHPLLPFTIRGMLWYQGENGSGPHYDDRMAGMIAALRAKKGDDFPVYIVQLPNYGPANDDPAGGPQVTNFPVTRMEQLECLRIPRTGLVVTIDAGDAEDLHPKNKRDVGERLALWALAKDYGKTGLVCSGPLFSAMTVEGATARIAFDGIGSGLMVGRKDGRNPAVEDQAMKLARFAIAGTDKRWAWADAVIEGDTVVVSSPQVPQPVAVRYAFSMNPQGCNLYNREGLPASPFRTDDW
jgi:sialate O-acetylesterase